MIRSSWPRLRPARRVLSGLESAVLPLDLCVEAEMLGAGVDFRSNAPRPEYPIVNRPVANSTPALHPQRGASVGDLRLVIPADLSQAGRLPVVLRALRELKDQVGQTVVIGAVMPGPFTLLTWIMPPGVVYTELMHPPANLGSILDELTEMLIEVATLYREAGADFITVHEMGGSPGVIGPKRFREVGIAATATLVFADGCAARVKRLWSHHRIDRVVGAGRRKCA